MVGTLEQFIQYANLVDKKCVYSLNGSSGEVARAMIVGKGGERPFGFWPRPTEAQFLAAFTDAVKILHVE